MNLKKNILVSVVGPTAVGKTALAIEIAKYFNTQIVSADSRQFYREMNIGTAKPDKEELAQVKHHFINSHSIKSHYSVGMYEKEALVLLDELFQRHDVVVLVGGSGLFFKAIWDGFDEMPAVDLDLRASLNRWFEEEGLEPMLKELKEKDPEYFGLVDQQNHQRVIRALEVIRSSGETFTSFRKGKAVSNRNFVNLKFGLNMDREILFDRINKRMDLMIDAGLFEEAKALFPYKDHNALQTVGYTEIFNYLDGKYDREEAVRLLKRNSRRYAKRQLTWFRKDEEIKWYQPNESERIIRLIADSLNA
ncbi:tRNA (adenosine(37)-N6)-dimethylallyltransferase MiaA [Marinoscillum sp. 108]|uniref:tRNA (adenosine(37)-N6)-dimethylallyltransferase MiaA n=1 Tax=Marinoscillum sp. 108 TaxID=2653151 RepID=UPI0012F43674|nr:tRNA (adenosine(37)-N6)-dimethylallyltransferase MiaA [Marinoscillum sp. 108]VXD10658.1 tRNA dimethylallyltransferase [Marinoscillum sp. 108]